jgi:hypothetical protein
MRKDIFSQQKKGSLVDKHTDRRCFVELNTLSSEEIKELFRLVVTQFSPEADNPQIPNDIMCCGKYKRCPLPRAHQIIESQEEIFEESYPVVLYEGESLFLLPTIEMMFQKSL